MSMIAAPDAVIRLRPEAVEWRLVEDEVVALDLKRSRYLGINPSGAVLWPLLADGASREELAAALTERFELDDATAGRDVDAFLYALHALELISAA